ncbi:MAG: excinuclease ABC subunit UvrC [Treponema sp.]|nr:excinuclease ABC subunit UvrC [Treponema sp.]
MTAKTVFDTLHETALKAPLSSGVYLWRNPEETVIYVGKAKNLKNRLSSYFSGKKDIKTRLLIAHASSIEYITTANEYEALLLENNLIKKYNPRYNICLKDGKSYPVLRITNEDFPRIFKTRSVLQDGSQYFGPFPDAYALDTFIDAIFRLYPLRRCRTFKTRSSPCLYYHMGQCKAPCCSKISEESYNEYVGEISSLLEENDAQKGSSSEKGDSAIQKLTDEMKAAAKELNFEKAARLRDGIKALMVMKNQNVVETFDSTDCDYIAHYREGELVSFTVLKIRHGKLLGRNNFREESLNEDDELLSEFMNVYYGEGNALPPVIYVPTQSGMDIVTRWVQEVFQCDTQIVLVTDEMESAGRHKAAMNMAFQNAREDIVRRLRERGDNPAMEELKNLLELPSLPVRIEGFDIAHIGGKFPVASLISFYNGNPDKKNYRYFRLKTTDGLIDDFASMKEAVSRRYTRLLNEQSELPDLILIDGGIGQVNAVYQVLQALSLDIPVAGLAKRDEEIWLPHASKPVCLPKRSDALRLLQRVRDETHRFATSRNQNLRTKENVDSIFLEISGIGPKKAIVLQKKYTTLENLCSASESEIAQTVHVRADGASSILMEARALLEKRNAKKEEQKKSLNVAGTTKETAAYAGYISDLASSALD